MKQCVTIPCYGCETKCDDLVCIIEDHHIAYVAPRRCAEVDKLINMFATATTLPPFKKGMNLIVDQSHYRISDGEDLEVNTREQIADYMRSTDPFGDKIAFVVSPVHSRRIKALANYTKMRNQSGSKKKYRVFTDLDDAIAWAKKNDRATSKGRPYHSSEGQVNDDCDAC